MLYSLKAIIAEKLIMWNCSKWRQQINLQYARIDTVMRPRNSSWVVIVILKSFYARGLAKDCREWMSWLVAGKFWELLPYEMKWNEIKPLHQQQCFNLLCPTPSSNDNVNDIFWWQIFILAIVLREGGGVLLVCGNKHHYVNE